MKKRKMKKSNLKLQVINTIIAFSGVVTLGLMITNGLIDRLILS